MLRQFASFSSIGLINTLIHLGVVVALVDGISFHPVPANALAFAIANVFSFFANTRWSFGNAPTIARYRRFFLVSVAGLAITVLFSGLAAAADWHYLAGVGLICIALPLLSFFAHRSWTFTDPR